MAIVVDKQNEQTSHHDCNQRVNLLMTEMFVDLYEGPLTESGRDGQSQSLRHHREGCQYFGQAKNEQHICNEVARGWVQKLHKPNLRLFDFVTLYELVGVVENCENEFTRVRSAQLHKRVGKWHLFSFIIEAVNLDFIHRRDEDCFCCVS